MKNENAEPMSVSIPSVGDIAVDSGRVGSDDT